MWFLQEIIILTTNQQDKNLFKIELLLWSTHLFLKINFLGASFELNFLAPFEELINQFRYQNITIL